MTRTLIPKTALALGLAVMISAAVVESPRAALGEVASFQKISATRGGFDGPLAPFEKFGYAVGVIDDLDGDGIPELAVGTNRRNHLWILFMNTDGTVRDELLIAEGSGGFGGDVYSGFGSAVVSFGDLDGDGIDEVAVGERLSNDGGDERGAVWILFLDSDGTVRSEQKISDTVGGFGGTLADSDRFGASLAAPGDLDGDGVVDLAVGAPQVTSDSVDRSAVWVLLLNADGTVKSSASIGQTDVGLADQGFGRTLVSPGDVDGDGVSDLATAAYFGNLWFLFLNADGTLKSFTTIDPPSSSLGLASSLAFPGDFNGDGIGDLVLGDDSDDGNGSNRGAVWIQLLDASGGSIGRQRINDTEGNFPDQLDEFDFFGRSADTLGDLNGDGVVDLAVGADFDDDGDSNVGAVYVLFLDGCGNGTLDGGEICDDGNTADGDGCDSNCTPTGCGNSVVTAGEVCDDGNDLRCDGCWTDCTVTGFCGDGVVDPGCRERCDDGNNTSGDGCEFDCIPTAALEVLYDQTDSASGNGVPDQAFEAYNWTYSAEAADDFVVTDSVGWDIRGLNIRGTSTGPAILGKIFFFDDNGGRPAELPIPGCDYPEVTDLVDDQGSIDYRFPICSLPPGTYWVAEQARQDVNPSGQHFWSNRSVQSGAESVWRNVEQGFGTVCTRWTPQTECGVGGGSSPDLLFQLIGQPATDQDGGGTGGGSTGGGTGAVPSTGPVGLLGILLALGGASGYMITRGRNRRG